MQVVKVEAMYLHTDKDQEVEVITVLRLDLVIVTLVTIVQNVLRLYETFNTLHLIVAIINLPLVYHKIAIIIVKRVVLINLKLLLLIQATLIIQPLSEIDNNLLEQNQ